MLIGVKNFCLLYCKQVIFLLQDFFFFCIFVGFLLVILVFEMAPNHDAEVQSQVPKCETAVMCLTEKMPVLDKLYLVSGFSAAGHEFIPNESTIHIK